MATKVSSTSIVPGGVQGIVLVRESVNIFDQRYVLVQDHDDRGTGTGIKKSGLPGGTIESGETIEKAFWRELYEEIAMGELSSFKKFGSFPKTRPNGYVNQNTLFILRLGCEPSRATNDPNEVSKIHIWTLRKIICYAGKGHIHEGSIRLIFHYLNGDTGISLNLPVSLKNSIFCF